LAPVCVCVCVPEYNIEMTPTSSLRAMREQWYRHGDGFILVFSITSRESFEEMIEMHKSILRSKDKDQVPIVMVANKSDLEYQREVGKHESRALARQLQCPFVEASAKEGINVDVAFTELVKLIRKDQKVGV
jgi:GTPase KRas